MGAEATATIDMKQAAKTLGETLGVPNNLILRDVLPDVLSSNLVSSDIIPALEGGLDVSEITE
jgi:hypothetical protein